MPALGMVAAVLLSAVGGVPVMAASGAPIAPIAGTSDQETSGAPTPTDAFAPGDCPAGIVSPDGTPVVECGMVSVPLHHAEPDGAQISVAVARLDATTSERQADPVVIVVGGADGSALDLGQRLATLAAALPDRDLVLVDQRGGRYSSPFLQCGEDDSARLAEATGQIAGTAALDAHLLALAACATRMKDVPFDLSAFSSTESAQDIDSVVTALGYAGPIDLIAIGAGTRTALDVLRASPTSIRSVVLDSVPPASGSATAVLARDAWAVVGALSAACAEDEGCSAIAPDLAGSIVSTAATLQETPAHASVDVAGTATDVSVDGSAFVTAIVGAFATAPDAIADIPPLVAAAASGDVSGVAGRLVAAAQDSTRADLLGWTLRCGQDLAGATDYDFTDVPQSFQVLSGRVGDRDLIPEVCGVLGVGDAADRDPVTSDVPALTLSGEFDPWSPGSAADAVRSTLSASYGLEIPDVGHVVLPAAECPITIAASFISDPTLEPDASCIADMPEFSIATASISAEPSLTPDASAHPDRSAKPDRTARPGKTAKPAKPPKARPVKVGIVKVATGFENANGINNAGDKRLFVSEQEGYVEVLKPNKDGTFRDAGKFLDMRSRVICCGEKGFLGIAFPPDYAQTGYFYVTFAGTGHTWNLEERRVSATDPDRADPDYKRRLIRVYKPLDYHWAGDMHFGPDGYLYVTVGDGGFGGTTADPGDPSNRAQDLSVIFGKMLRIEPRGSRKQGDRYTVPPSNPFVKKAGAQPEIWAYGLRNPWRWSFDRLTNALWIGDVGMWTWEEVNRAEGPNAGKGDNFGWRRMEGPACYNPARRCDNGKLTKPFSWYGHQNGMCAVTGGYVYRGKRYPALRSWYVFGDYCSGRIMLLNSAGRPDQRPKVALDTKAQISAFGEGSDGELYVVDYGASNTLYRITGSPR